MPYFIVMLWLLCASIFASANSSYIYKKPDTRPRLAIIIDDIGYNIPLGQRAVAIDAPLTLAVLPHTPGAKQLAKTGFLSGKQIMLHAPMSNVGDKALGPGALTSNMNKQDFIRTLRGNITAIPHISGVNNHMGSQLTTQTQPMQWLMQELKSQDLFFVDSLTHSRSVALKLAYQYGLATAKRDIFLDNVQDENYIETALRQAIALAKHQGYAIAIGHPYAETLAVLEKVLPSLARSEVKIVHASEITTFKTRAYNNNLKNK